MNIVPFHEIYLTLEISVITVFKIFAGPLFIYDILVDEHTAGMYGFNMYYRTA